MNVLSCLSIAASLLAVAYAYWQNPDVLSPRQGAKVSPGQHVRIAWEHAETGYVNIDLVNAHQALYDGPVSIALGIPGGQGEFVWTVPEGLPAGHGYQVRVWGVEPPKACDSHGNSGLFAIGHHTDCKIAWEVPAEQAKSGHEQQVDINLYRVGEVAPIAKIATVPASQGEFIWSIPADQRIQEAGPVYVAIDAPKTGNSHSGPAQHVAAQTEPINFGRWTPAEQQLIKLQKLTAEQNLQKHRDDQLYIERLQAAQEGREPRTIEQITKDFMAQRAGQKPGVNPSPNNNNNSKATPEKKDEGKPEEKTAADKKKEEEEKKKEEGKNGSVIPRRQVEIKGRKDQKAAKKNAAGQTAQVATAGVLVAALVALLPFF